MYVYIGVYIYIYIYRERERERERNMLLFKALMDAAGPLVAERVAKYEDLLL